MSQARGKLLTQAAFSAVWVTLACAGACSRTDDPFETYASASKPGGAGASNAGTPGSGGGVGQAGKGGQPTNAGAGNQGSGADAAGGAPVGGSDGGPKPPSDFGCGEAPVASGSFTRQNLRAAAADCALHHYCRFEGGARWLEEQVSQYADSPSPDTLASARQAFEQAMALWSVAELFQFGPAASSSLSAGKDTFQGQGLRELIHPWHLTVRCRVEEQVALQNYADDINDVFRVPISGRGLFGLDYLLYYAESDTACTPTSVAGKAWASLSSDEITARKLDYAAALGSDLVTRVAAIRSAWASDGGNFRPQFVDATGYPDEDKAMTVLAWSLLYVEREVKDWKLGIPAGYTLTSPVTLAESPYSGLGTENLRANLHGFRALFQGCGPDGEGLGFDDWLTASGHPELAQDIVVAWEGAQAAADAYPRFAEATPAELEALYRAVKALTDLLKTDLFGDGSPLELDLPEGIEGDTD